MRKHIPEQLPPVEIDYVQIEQVITNLLENALRYTSFSKGILEAHKGRIWVEAREGGVPYSVLYCLWAM